MVYGKLSEVEAQSQALPLLLSISTKNDRGTLHHADRKFTVFAVAVEVLVHTPY